MVDAWPATLPQEFMVDGFRHAVGDTRLRSQPDSGPAKVRPRSSAAVKPLSGVMIMDTDQWEDLLEFGADTLLQWSLPFTFPDPDGGSALLVRFAGSLPERTPHGTVTEEWRVSLDLEVLP